MSWLQIKELEERRQKSAYEARKILTDNPDGLSEEHRSVVDKCHADVDKYTDEIKRYQRQEQIDKSTTELIGRENRSTETTTEKRGSDGVKAFEKMLRFGPHTLSVEERSAMSTAAYRPGDLEERLMTSTTANEGAEFAPQDFLNKFVLVETHVDSVREAGAEVIVSSNGRTLPYPRIDDTSNTGERLANQDTAANDAGADPDTEDLLLGAFQYTSKIVKLSRALGTDSAYPIADVLTTMLRTRIDRVRNTDHTQGTGSSQPQGCAYGATEGHEAASASAISRPDLLSLIHSLDRRYRANAKLMFSDDTLRAVRALAGDNGQPVWYPGSVAGGQPPTIEGLQYVINNDMEDIGADNKSVLIADWAEAYVIRDVLGVEVFVDPFSYLSKLQFGYLAAVRGDGGIKNPSAIRALAHPSSSG